MPKKPSEQEARDLFGELVKIMAALRDPVTGCPWDLKQTHATLTKYLIEEAYEVTDAVETGETAHLAEELGDVLLQVVFHAQLGSDAGTFNICDVIRHINHKLVDRHPHVFGETKVRDADEVLQNWEIMKAKKKGNHASLLTGIPRTLPALLRSRRIQERAAQVGFDWKDVQEVLAKVDEELSEFREACGTGDPDRIEDELGDLLFSMVNVSRFLGTDPEASLHRTVGKFIQRFEYIEEKVRDTGRSLEEVPLEEMDRYWEEAKKGTGD